MKQECNFAIFFEDMALLKRHWCYVTGVTFCPCFISIKNMCILNLKDRSTWKYLA